MLCMFRVRWLPVAEDLMGNLSWTLSLTRRISLTQNITKWTQCTDQLWITNQNTNARLGSAVISYLDSFCNLEHVCLM